MNYKKVLTGVALSVGLLVSASPAFATSPSTMVKENNIVQDEISVKALHTKYIYHHNISDFKNIEPDDNGINWYLKGIEYKDGWYVGKYQANY
ncbi:MULTISPECIES: hypothetical protein [Bacillus]|uniref:hypothetical protein n=1 Tax=Bacillus TaxID=1386 RepID=UPI000C76D7B5|nr:hypothetical protein [Bacillus subtilis]MBL3637624.1 hypothetical protein [Alkalicoccobacillus gibsonii]UAW07955.1 hypothetical protein [Bacillus phage BUCT082]WIT27889.1 hypothetical protein [Bacillus phage SPbetaL6]WIT28072.1 hypothetical protein [Bacillus phage SPbetaL7]MCY8985892.1 hypothetical protein [Bacillus subtilis]